MKFPSLVRWHDPLLPLRRAAAWWFDNEWLPMPGRWAPHVLGFIMGRRAQRVLSAVRAEP